jgi:hypothetical protein
MMPNLRISYPDIPARCLRVYSNGDDTWEEDLNILNSRSGARGARSRLLDDSLTSVVIDYDMGNGNTATCDHLIISNASTMYDDVEGTVTDIEVFGDSSDTFGSAITPTPDVSSLYGPDSADYIQTFTETAARRFWRVEITKPALNLVNCGKIYLGKFFDFGIDLSGYSIDYADRPPYTSRADAGTIIIGRRERSRYGINLRWENVTDAKAIEFSDSILAIQHKHRGVFLYTDAVNEVLDGHRIIHGDIVRPRIVAQGDPDSNVIQMTIEEWDG